MKVFRCSIYLLILLFPASLFSSQSLSSFKFSSDTLKIADSTEIIKSQIFDSLKKIILADSVIPIENRRLINPISESVITRDELLMSNFFDIYSQLSKIPGAFYYDLGAPSNLGQLLINGNGWKHYGINLNNRNILDPATNYLNLYEINPEELSSINILTSPRAFLYNRLNENIIIDFSSRELFSKVPYSRLKYIEAPYDNLFLDGIFNVFLQKRIHLEFGVTKQTTKGRFRNSDFDVWKGRLRLAWFPSNLINAIMTYRYTRTENKFNEGIDVNSIVPRPGNTITDVLYDELQAPVVNNLANQYESKNHIDLELRGSFFHDSLSNSYLNFYFSEAEKVFGDYDGTRIHSSELYGIQFRQYFHYGINNFEFISSTELKNFNSPYLGYKKLKNFDASGLWEIKLFKFLSPALFGKFNYFNDFKTFSFGSDLNIFLSQYLSAYAGASLTQIFQSPDETFFVKNKFDYSNSLNINTVINFNNGFMKLSFSGFMNNSKLINLTGNNPYSPKSYDFINDIYFTLPEISYTFGASFNGSISYKNFTFSFTNSYLKKQAKDGATFNLKNQPEFTSSLSLFYRNIHFNNNLDINAGFRFSFFTEYNGLSLSPEKLFFTDFRIIDSVLTDYSLVKINSNIKLDFIISAKIQNLAIVYFALENITNARYYLIPYYPVNDFGIRFGIAWEFYD